MEVHFQAEANHGTPRAVDALAAFMTIRSTHWSTTLMAQETGLNVMAISRIWKAFCHAETQTHDDIRHGTTTLGLIHSLTTTAAHVHDLTPRHGLLHGEEQRILGDAGYLGIQNREAHQQRSVDWFINCRHSQRRQHHKASPFCQLEQMKSHIRSKVEHLFSRIRNQFGYSKVRYRGCTKTRTVCTCWWVLPLCCA